MASPLEAIGSGLLKRLERPDVLNTLSHDASSALKMTNPLGYSGSCERQKARVRSGWAVVILAIAGLLTTKANARDAAVVITEIQYHPDTNDFEWIELHSLSGVDIDLSGWRFAEGVDFTFPEGTIIPGHGWIVVAANPDAASLAGIHALGPWNGSLNNDGETISLLNRSGREMDTVAFSNNGAWPSGPDGSGASLARWNCECADPGASGWAASAEVGGSPGRENFALGDQEPQQQPALVINEVSAGGSGFQIELANLGTSKIDLANYMIRSSDGAEKNLSGTLKAGGFSVLNSSELGFIPANSDTLFLFTRDGRELIDAQHVTNKLRGRSPKFPNRWLYPANATFGSANVFDFHTDVVINEVMYDAMSLKQEPFEMDPEQWVELYNRASVPVALDGWSFSDGIRFRFPAGTSIPAGGYLVVSNHSAALKAKWPSVANRIIGDFSGSIKHRGERLELSDDRGNPVSEVTFFKDSPWPTEAHGGGSSLELRDPRADLNRPEAWAASNEMARGSWQAYTFEGAASPSVENDPTLWNEFLFGLLGKGSFLIDDISVIESPDKENRQLIQNGDFSSGTDGWRFLGTHSHATVLTMDPSGCDRVLRIDATDESGHMHNHAETTLKSDSKEVTIDSTRTYRASFRARWLSGSNRLNTWLYFYRSPHTALLPVKIGGGTPGASNTALIANLGPTFSDLRHSPAVPSAGQPATVSVKAGDPDGLTDVSLDYSADGGPFTRLAMSDKGNGRFTAVIPGQHSGTKVQFYVRASDKLGATGMAPANGPRSRAMIPWQDGQDRLKRLNVMPNNIRIVMTPSDIETLHIPTNVMSNDRLPCTVIWNERDVYYDCAIHLHGSAHGRDQSGLQSFNVKFPAGQPLLGVQDTIVIDRSGAGDGAASPSQKEMLIKRAILHAGGIPGSEDDICWLIAPQSADTGPAILGRQRVVSDEYLDSAYANGSEGDLFKYELIYSPTSTVDSDRESLKLPMPDSVAGVGLTGLGGNKEAYRRHWLISNHGETDDYSRLMTFLSAFGRPADDQYFSDTNAQMDVSEWLRAFAMGTLFGVGDNYATGGQHNLLLYRRPTDGRWIFFPYDLDYSFHLDAKSSMFQNEDLNKLVSTASPQGVANLRTYWTHVHDICQTSFSSTYLAPWAAHYSAFASEDLAQFMNYIATRRSYALDQLQTAIPPVNFRVTTVSRDKAPSSVTLSGTAWVDVARLQIEGSSQPLAVTWLTPSTWCTTLTVGTTDTIIVNAFNSLGKRVGISKVSIPAQTSHSATDHL